MFVSPDISTLIHYLVSLPLMGVYFAFLDQECSGGVQTNMTVMHHWEEEMRNQHSIEKCHLQGVLWTSDRGMSWESTGICSCVASVSEVLEDTSEQFNSLGQNVDFKEITTNKWKCCSSDVAPDALSWVKSILKDSGWEENLKILGQLSGWFPEEQLLNFLNKKKNFHKNFHKRKRTVK